ncbi:MAG: trimethylamine methyltransferase family protein [Phycisphaerales bacterium]|nr:MAG: trimethylamine methyltransferase family protein [Phycisphaerales bacterium]
MRPTLALLSPDLIERIDAEARTVLATLGVRVHNDEVLNLLEDCGGHVDRDEHQAQMPEEMIDRALSGAPRTVTLYDLEGRNAVELAGGSVHFTPGSSALTLLDGERDEARPPDTADYVRYARLVGRLEHIATQSTAFIPADVPEGISDSYRLYLSLMFCDKPVITGGFGLDSLAVMKDLLLAVRGSESALKEKPFAVFSCCALAPLSWSEVTSAHLIQCARASIPAEIISMPMAGFTSPVTLVGTLVQHTAEVLSGVVISQCASAGAPVLFGGSATIFDVRHATAPMGAVESAMLSCACNEIGKHLHLPTQAYIGLTDAKVVDAQAGLEASMGATMAALSGINSVAGPGMMDYQNCFSLEKLVLDNEMCGMALRLARGIEPCEDFPSLRRFEELLAEKHLMISEHTRHHLREEQHLPGPLIERAERSKWEALGRESLADKARAEVARLTGDGAASSLPADVRKQLVQRMEHEAKRCGMDRMPPIET